MSILKRYILKIKDNTFFKNVIVLLSGTAFGQILLLIASPILTRLYMPEDFGVLAVYVSLVSLLGVIITLRYELAIPLNKNNQVALNITIISIVISCIISLILFFVVLIFQGEIAKYLNTPQLTVYLFFLPISVLGVGLYRALSFWAIRYSYFNLISRTKITQSFGQAITQLGIGLFIYGPFGLILGESLGRIVGSGKLLVLAVRKERNKIKLINFKGLLNVAKRYKKFPLVSSPSALFNTAGLQLPQIFLVLFYGAQIGGLYILLNKVIGLPMQMLGQAVSQVYFSESSKLIHTDKPRLKRLIITTTTRLLVIGCLPVLILSFFGPFLFEFVFGPDWRLAGEYVKYIALMFLLQFVVSPISQTLTILEYQGWQLMWDIFRCILVICVFFLCNILNVAIEQSLLFFSLIMSFCYILLFIVSYYAVGHSEGVVNDEVKQ